MSEPTVLYATDNGVATITINRPKLQNAIDLPTLEALVDAFDQAQGDDDVRVIVLTGGGDNFCAGADQGEMTPRAPGEWQTIVDRYLDPVRQIAGGDKPVIGRLLGSVVGGGLGLALACDYRIASSNATFCAPFVKIGLAGCDMSAGYFLPRLIGVGRATEMMMSARFVKAEEADRWGLVTRVVAPEELDAAVDKLARSLAHAAPIAMRFTKQAIRRSLDRGMEEEFDYEIFAQVQCLQTADHREALSAFREKRRPKFEGR